MTFLKAWAFVVAWLAVLVSLYLGIVFGAAWIASNYRYGAPALIIACFLALSAIIAWANKEWPE